MNALAALALPMYLQYFNTVSAMSVVALFLSYGVPIALRLWRGPGAFIPGEACSDSSVFACAYTSLQEIW